MKPIPSPSVDSSLGVPEFPEKPCQNNWNPHSLNIAAATCVRSTLEPCALILWLMDPKVDARNRIGRILAFRYEAQDQIRKFAHSANLAVERRAENRMDEIAKDADERGYKVLQDRKGKRIGIHEDVRSKATQMIGEYLNNEETYRMLSTVAHANAPMLLSLIYNKPSSNPNTMVRGVPATTAVRKGNDPRWIASLGLAIADTLSRAALAYGTYIGWDKLDIANIRAAERELLQSVENGLHPSPDRPAKSL